VIDSLGTQSWEGIARFMPHRSPRQCRDRYKNYLLESLTTEPWTPEEDAVVIQQFHLIGPKWAEIGKILKRRSGSNAKNRWHKHLCRLDAARSLRATAIVEEPPADELVPVDWESDIAGPPPQCTGPPDFLSPGVDSAFSVDRPWNGGFSIDDSLF
jgi:hypothetical protein